MKNLVLIGMMGSAKTTTGKLVASRLNLPFFDGDDVYESMFRESISDTFERRGEAVFRQRELQVYKTLGALSDSVIACGGGVVLGDENMIALKANGVVCRLTASPETIYERVSRNTDRPLVREGGLERIEKIMSEREHLYAKYSDFTIDNTRLSPTAAADKIISLFGKLR